jgi:hypothetical protein
LAEQRLPDKSGSARASVPTANTILKRTGIAKAFEYALNTICGQISIPFC